MQGGAGPRLGLSQPITVIASSKRKPGFGGIKLSLILDTHSQEQYAYHIFKIKINRNSRSSNLRKPASEATKLRCLNTQRQEYYATQQTLSETFLLSRSTVNWRGQATDRPGHNTWCCNWWESHCRRQRTSEALSIITSEDQRVGRGQEHHRHHLFSKRKPGFEGTQISPSYSKPGIVRSIPTSNIEAED